MKTHRTFSDPYYYIRSKTGQKQIKFFFFTFLCLLSVVRDFDEVRYHISYVSNLQYVLFTAETLKLKTIYK